jgi:hypothetical protein
MNRLKEIFTAIKKFCPCVISLKDGQSITCIEALDMSLGGQLEFDTGNGIRRIYASDISKIKQTQPPYLEASVD